MAKASKMPPAKGKMPMKGMAHEHEAAGKAKPFGGKQAVPFGKGKK